MPDCKAIVCCSVELGVISEGPEKKEGKYAPQNSFINAKCIMWDPFVI